jgi:hypothetical protein
MNTSFRVFRPPLTSKQEVWTYWSTMSVEFVKKYGRALNNQISFGDKHLGDVHRMSTLVCLVSS